MATADELKAALAKVAAGGITTAEIRFDSLAASELPAALDIAAQAARDGMRIIATFRPLKAGGLRNISDDERVSFWNAAAQCGFWGCDLEPDDFALFDRELIAKTECLIVSFHDFRHTDSSADPAVIFEKLAAIPRASIKIAIAVEDSADAAGLWSLFGRARATGRKLIPIAMGEAGKWTRVLGPAFGSPLTYASADDSSAVAPGQISARDLRDLFRTDSITQEWEIFGLLAGDTSYSLSPRIHNSAFAVAGMERVFIPFQSRRLADFVNSFIGSGLINLCGFAVTNPHKIEIMRFLDHLDENSKRVGAVNTVKIVRGRLMGFNTDVAGFIEPLRQQIPDLKSARAAIIGTGGAARAAVFALLSEGANVSVFGRDLRKTTALAEEFGIAGRQFVQEDNTDFRDFDIVVNATPAGTAGEFGEVKLVSAEQLRGVRCVYDLVYNPQRTPLLVEAEKVGATAIGGLQMLVAQAEAQFEIWTGEKPPAGVMFSAVRNRLAATPDSAEAMKQR